jgi:hypothetical protein
MRVSFLKMAGLLALVAVAGAFYAVPSVAQTVRAALTKNIDERGRNPYSVQMICSVNPGEAFCAATPAPVPANKRLVLQQVNASVDVYNNDAPDGVAVKSGAGNAPLDLQLKYVRPHRYMVSEQVLQYFEPGGTPTCWLSLSGNSTSVNDSVVFTLSGYLVDLNQ